MKAKFLLLCGLGAPLLYILTVFLGGLLRPDYSHLSQPVSDLIASGAPNKPVLDWLFVLYNVLTTLFGMGLYSRIYGSSSGRNTFLGLWGALLLIAEGFFGLLTLLFPEPSTAIAPTFANSGGWHIVFAGLSSLTTMLAMLFLGLYFFRVQKRRSAGWYSLGSLAIVFISGGLAAFAVANHRAVGGLLERLTIGGFLQWLGVIACLFYGSAQPASLVPTNRILAGHRPWL